MLPAEDPVIHSLLIYLAMIHVELDAVKRLVSTLLDKVIVQDRLPPSPDGADVRRGPVQETWISDALVPLELKRRFQQQVAALVASQQEKDWHPGSHDQVLDVVHPSLHCIVFGQTKRVVDPALLSLTTDAATHMQAIVGNGQAIVWSPFATSSSGQADPWIQPSRASQIKYQWLPSEFAVAADGKSVQIQSYINNLHPVTHRALYDSIAAIFARFLPLFAHVLASLSGDAPPPLCNASLHEHGWDYKNHWELPLRPLVPSDAEPFAPAKRFELRGSTLQVIVKIAEIHLSPESPRYAGGSWHVEGTAAEQIVATGIYYFGSENITESRLAFRAGVEDPDYTQDDHRRTSAS
ncbi:hypothetical protein ATCC90586_011322 [Pythium insidiosum]|nr:hypothetical protein ATCC90586_011322 [Pythium insidiosum]